MSATTLPPISDLPTLSTTERAHVLDLLFEPSTSLHTLSVSLLHDQTFASYDDLIAAIGIQLTDLAESSSTSDTEWLLSILTAHPRLGAKKVESAQSQAEQAQLNTGGAEEAQELQRLNDEYEKKHGLIYVVFVDGRSRPVIMEDMKKRIAQGTVEGERKAAIKAMCEIAADRARKLQQ